MSFGRLERREAAKPIGEINMTPLIDVMLVLLVIFMITAPLMSSSLRLDLPKSDAASASDAPQFITITLSTEGQLLLDDVNTTPAALRAAVKKQALARPDTEVRLRADQAVPYGRVAELIGWLQEAGLDHLAFVAEPQSAPLTPTAPAQHGPQ